MWSEGSGSGLLGMAGGHHMGLGHLKAQGAPGFVSEASIGGPGIKELKTRAVVPSGFLLEP